MRGRRHCSASHAAVLLGKPCDFSNDQRRCGAAWREGWWVAGQGEALGRAGALGELTGERLSLLQLD